MAEQFDGSIVIDTEIDTKGFKAGSAELQGAIKSLVNKVNSLGPSFRKALSGTEGAVNSFNAKTQSLEDTVAELQGKLDELGNQTFPTDKYLELSQALEAAGRDLEALLAKQKELKALGVSENSQQWRRLEYQITRAGEKCDTYSGKLHELEESGAAQIVGSQTAEYARLSSELEDATNRLTAMNKEANRSRTSFGSFLTRAAASLAASIKAAASGMAKMLFHSKKMNSQFGGLISGAKKFALSLLGARGVWALLRKAVSAYMAENQQLSNTLSACWSGIGNLLGPIITRIINLVAQAVAYITTFLKLFGVFGKSTTKAINSAGGAATKATDKLKRQLAAFDELNILSDNSSDGGGGGGGGGDAAGSLPDVELPDWAKLMADQIKAGDWTAAAKTLTGQLNSMIAGVDWAGVGDKIGYYLNGALTFLATAILTFDWYALGADLATSINHIIYSVDWANLGTLLAGKLRVVILTAGGFLLNLDWNALAKGFSDFAVNFFKGISDAVKAIDWQQLGHNVTTFVANIDWTGIANALFDGIGAALGGLTAFLWGIIKDAWNNVVTWWNANARKDGEFTMAGLLEGIWNGIKNIGTWIYEHIFKPFITGFKSAFGIASPSKVMATQGGFIVQGLLQGVTNAWGSITGFFSNKLKTLLNTIKNQGWSGVGSNICNGIADGISSGWSWLTNKVSSLASSLLRAAKSALGIHSPSRLFRDEIGLNIGYGVGEGVEASQPSILKSVSGVADAIADELNSNTYTIRPLGVDENGNISRGLDGFSETITDKFSGLVNSLQDIAARVTFSVPAVAGGVVPYKAAAAAASGGSYGSDLSSAIESSNGDLISAIAQGLASQTTALISAIESNRPSIKIDRTGLAEAVIQEINRRSRATGKSPLIG